MKRILIPALTALLLALIVNTAAAQSWFGGARGANATSSVSASELAKTPAFASAGFHFGAYEADNFDFNAFTALLNVGSGMPTGIGFFNISLAMEIGSTDLDGVNSVLFKPMGRLDVEFVFSAGSLDISAFVGGQFGFKLLALSLDPFSNELYYLPIEAVFGGRFYLGGTLFIELAGNAGVDIGLDSSGGGTPDDLTTFGFNLSVGSRF